MTTSDQEQAEKLNHFLATVVDCVCENRSCQNEMKVAEYMEHSRCPMCRESVGFSIERLRSWRVNNSGPPELEIERWLFFTEGEDVQET